MTIGLRTRYKLYCLGTKPTQGSILHYLHGTLIRIRYATDTLLGDFARVGIDPGRFVDQVGWAHGTVLRIERCELG